jgi:membrane-associated protease RseP (regulator of RpoE activity)
MIGTVVPGGPAERAGIRAGDEIVSISGTKVGDSRQVKSLLGRRSAGEMVRIAIRRGGAVMELEVTLGQRPLPPAAAPTTEPGMGEPGMGEPAMGEPGMGEAPPLPGPRMAPRAAGSLAQPPRPEAEQRAWS